MMRQTESVQEHLLGCVFVGDNEAMDRCLDAGVDESWFLDLPQRVWRVLADQHAKGRGVDPHSAVRADQTLDLVTMIRWMELGEISRHNLPEYIATLADERLLRQVREVAGDGWQSAENATPDTARAIVDRMQREWLAVESPNLAPEPLGVVGRRLVSEWRTPKEQRGHRVTWPLRELQEGIGDLTDEYVFLSAKESVGKSAFVLQWMIDLGLNGVPSALASLESPTPRVVARALSYLAQVNTLRLRNGNGGESEYAAAENAADRLNALPMRICDRTMTAEQLRAWARLQAGSGAAIVIVDNMKHIQVNEKFRSPVEHFRDLSMKCKRIRDDIRKPVVVIHHSNQEGDVSWSQDIRRDADIILLLEADEGRTVEPRRDNDWIGTWWVKCKVDKNRDGMKGMEFSWRFD